MQTVEVELDPGETVLSETGAMHYMEDDIEFEAKLGDGSQATDSFFGKLLSAGKRAITGESLFMTHFTNRGSRVRRVAFAAPFPGKIIALDLASHGEEVLCQKDSFLAAALGTELRTHSTAGSAWASSGASVDPSEALVASSIADPRRTRQRWLRTPTPRGCLPNALGEMPEPSRSSARYGRR